MTSNYSSEQYQFWAEECAQEYINNNREKNEK